jgi:hypothetical protein
LFVEYGSPFSCKWKGIEENMHIFTSVSLGHPSHANIFGYLVKLIWDCIPYLCVF